MHLCDDNPARFLRHRCPSLLVFDKGDFRGCQILETFPRVEHAPNKLSLNSLLVLLSTVQSACEA